MHYRLRRSAAITGANCASELALICTLVDRSRKQTGPGFPGPVILLCYVHQET